MPNTQLYSQARRKVYKPLACEKTPPEVYEPLVCGQAWLLPNISTRDQNFFTSSYAERTWEFASMWDLQSFSIGKVTGYANGIMSSAAVMPSCVIYFTDGWCDSFPKEPDYPTLWVSTDRFNFKPPFGEVINMEQRDWLTVVLFSYQPIRIHTNNIIWY